MEEFEPFNIDLKEKLEYFLQQPKEKWEKTALKYVNGFAEDELRRLVSLEKRKASGAFFTNDDLANTVFSALDVNFASGSVVFDPCCGAANMLISCANLAHHNKIKLTLLGTDIHEEFSEAARHRLSVLRLLFAQTVFNDYVRTGDGFDASDFYDQATHIITNPPFNQIIPPERVAWGSGKISAAALFIDKIIINTRPGTTIVAILPDVLRSGSRYEKWRKMVEENCEISTIHLLGQFDKYADVDVFAIKMTKRNKPTEYKTAFSWVRVDENARTKISDKFFVKVGPVVDNRDKKAGAEKPFITSRGLKGWQPVTDWPIYRLHKGKSFKSPFVVVKRTSRRGDSNRAIATLINIKEDVFVDNHLIVLLPKSGRLADCLELIEKLKNRLVDNWLDEQIRCRHLTVKVISDIPL